MSPMAKKVTLVADKQVPLHLFGWVKSDNHVAVERFLAGRKDAAQLADALMAEAVSPRMVGVLDEHAGKSKAPAHLPMAMPDIHRSWAWHNAL